MMNRFLEIAQIPPDAVLIDARPKSAYDAGHLAGSRNAEFVDKFLIRTPAQLEVFHDALQNLARGAGLHAGQRVVVFDAGRDSRATRLAWALEYAGFEVAVLRDGLNGYTGALETAPTKFARSDFTLESPRSELLATADDVLNRDAKTIVIDARASDEFSGAKAVSGSTKGGHIPGAINLDWQQLATATGIADAATLEQQLSAIPKDADVIVHCQSGARSSVVYHALKSVGMERVRNYLGSMNEWVSDENLPLEQGS
jgi:thiosulfate/3-mercaptopyruvate sulfurtransferase